MKKRIFAVALIAICLAILAYGTTAYDTVEDTAHNVITSGAVAIELQEWQQTEAGLIPYPDRPIAIMPATAVSKVVTLKNNDVECFLRCSVQIAVKDASGNEKDVSAAELSRIVDIAFNEEDWIREEGDSEWWYYQESLKPGKSTEPLFTGIAFDGPNMTNEYQNCTLEVKVSAQAVQAANNKATAREAIGWPAN